MGEQGDEPVTENKITDKGMQIGVNIFSGRIETTFEMEDGKGFGISLGTGLPLSGPEELVGYLGEIDNFVKEELGIEKGIDEGQYILGLLSSMIKEKQELSKIKELKEKETEQQLDDCDLNIEIELEGDELRTELTLPNENNVRITMQADPMQVEMEGFEIYIDQMDQILKSKLEYQNGLRTAQYIRKLMPLMTAERQEELKEHFRLEK